MGYGTVKQIEKYACVCAYNNYCELAIIKNIRRNAKSYYTKEKLLSWKTKTSAKSIAVSFVLF